MSRVVVFGNGLDSLLAAHAASVLGHDVLIYADPELHDMVGPQMLLAPIPMIQTKCASLSVFQHGEPDDFMHKLINQGGAGRGPEAYDMEVDGRMIWDAAGTYQWLLETYGRFVVIVPEGIDSKAVRTIMADVDPDVAISGIDRDDLCSDPNHSFAAANIVTMATAPQAGNLIKISGDPDDSWAMESHLFGDSIRHYGGHKHPPVSPEKLQGYIIPQGCHCDCLPDLDRVGKLGTWNHRWPTHHSFYDAFQNLDGR